MTAPRYEIVKVITLWCDTELPHPVGFLLRDLEEEIIKGYTFNETWNLINERGAVNCEAIANIKSVSGGGHFTWHILSSSVGLPDFNDEFWFIDIREIENSMAEKFSTELVKFIRRTRDSIGCFHS